MAFGIDFGTTNTCVVECLCTEYGITKTHYGENDQPFPSLIAMHPDKPFVFGWDVKKKRSQLIAEGYVIVSSFKSILGKKDCIVVGDKNYSPIDITATFLSYIKKRTEELSKRELNEAVIAIPVDFQPEQRRNLREAAKLAGIYVKSFVSEPSAAYVNCRDILAGDSNIAVFDWGGGTLDISLISVENKEILEIAVAGQRLGGDDIDMMLARHIHSRMMQKESIPRSFDDLAPVERDQIIERSEQAKKRLSQDDEVNVRLMNYTGKTMIRETISLDEFSKLIASKISEAEKLLNIAVDKAAISLGQLDAILMVGGSCEMQPIFQHMQEIGKEYNLKIYRPDGIQWAVAGGAAILSEQKPSYKLQNSFGVLLSDDSFFPIFSTGSLAPCKAQEFQFGVVEDTCNAIFVFSDDKKNIMKRISVPIKGFTSEGIHLNCEIDEDMIVQIEIKSDYAECMAVYDELNQLTFSYKI